ncbi:LysM peptidoglycan-binding domain-containing protein [Roseovarius autotrophicus]|uniref:LysM peptidoglycan-binding domain-containing protein n=1 Tax=Roseovarius autotrophicus TaxID=2824121 RepID=UPI0019EC7523|nr:LysM peptidoglycan-binding domain-containing protein [Roseovarius autotrophicus]MBE0452357.1 LysM peptidoglycan-binding domain-containing protein [Roseovarius sp.]
MSKLGGLGAGPRFGIAGIVVAVAVALGVYLSGQRGVEPEAQPPRAVAPEPQHGTGSTGVTETGSQPEPATTSEPAAALPEPPAIDTFRLDADGQTIVAGRATPGGTVAVLVDEARVALAEADGAGKFVALFALPASDVARSLTLALLLPDGDELRGRDEILIAPTPAPVATAAASSENVDEIASGVVAESEDPAARTAPESAAPQDRLAGLDPAVETEADAVAPAEAAPSQAPPVTASEPDLEPESAPVAPVVILSGEDGVRVLQAPAAPEPEAQSVTLDSIGYSDGGAVELSGRASVSEGFVRIYVDNRPVTTSRIQADGSWRSDLPEVDSGVYTLRIDEVGPAGDVTSRIETPFKREPASELAASPESAATPDTPRLSVVTVQPGSTLWAISRERYGQGILYLRVFEANRDRIRNPDLIYPGQVFELPD